MNARRILIVCTGNSCRSQLAEALVNHDCAGRWEATSAGTHPARSVHPLALKALAEVGIDHAGIPKGVEAVRDQSFDVVLTVCDSARAECPTWPVAGRRIHQGFPDPADAEGDEAQRLQVYRDVRDSLRRYLNELLAE